MPLAIAVQRESIWRTSFPFLSLGDSSILTHQALHSSQKGLWGDWSATKQIDTPRLQWHLQAVETALQIAVLCATALPPYEICLPHPRGLQPNLALNLAVLGALGIAQFVQCWLYWDLFELALWFTKLRRRMWSIVYDQYYAGFSSSSMVSTTVTAVFSQK